MSRDANDMQIRPTKFFMDTIVQISAEVYNLALE